MASRQQIGHKAGEMVGQAQVKKDEIMNKASNAAEEAKDKSSSHDDQNASDLKGQAAHFIQQTGEQVKNMAQGAAEAVKNTLGMNVDDNSNNRNNNNNNNNNCTANPSTNNPTANPSTNNPMGNPSTRI